MPAQEKIDRVSDLTDKLERCTITVTTNYTGISVNEMVEIRRRMRTAGADFTVVKNNLMMLAADGARRPQVKDIVQGPTAVAFGYDDPLEVAKAIADYLRTTRSVLEVRGAVMGRRTGHVGGGSQPPGLIAAKTPIGGAIDGPATSTYTTIAGGA